MLANTLANLAAEVFRLFDLALQALKRLKGSHSCIPSREIQSRLKVFTGNFAVASRLDFRNRIHPGAARQGSACRLVIAHVFRGHGLPCSCSTRYSPEPRETRQLRH